MKKLFALLTLLTAFPAILYAATIRDKMTFEGPVTFTNTVNNSSDLTVTPSATGYLNILTGNFKVGNGSPTTTLNGEDAYIEGTFEVDGVPRFDATTMILRGVTYTLPSADGTVGQVLSTNGSATLSWSTSGDNTLDAAYDQGGVGVGRTINATDGAVNITSTDADAAFLATVTPTPGSSAALGGLQVTSGANSTEDSLQIVNGGTGDDIQAGNGAFKVSSTGAITGLSATLAGGATSINDSSNFATNINTGSSSGALTLGGGTGTVAVNSSSWDISTTGAITGVSTISPTNDIDLANGKAVKSSTTTAETMKLQGYDVDNTTYRDVLTITNGNTVAAVFGSNNETLSVNSADWDISTTGAMTGIGAITMDGALTVNNATVTLYSNEAITAGHATNGAADDLTISLTGATDSSIILSSAGTGTDAISLQSSAGGVDVDAAAAQDVNVAGGQVALVSKDNAASAISLTANIGASETIVVTNTQGTAEGAITLTSTAGGVDIDAAAAKNIDVAGGQVLISSKDNAASAIALTANTGANETIVVTNTQGTNEAAITLTSTAGGIDMDAAAAKNIDIAGGQVLISSKDNVASAIALTANTGASETIVVTNTQGTGTGAITLTSTAGGITLNANSGITTGDAVTGDGTAALGGFLKTVTNDADGKNLAASESGTIQTNAAAGGAAAWNLPAAAAGIEYCFTVMAAQELRITPAAGDQINVGGSQGAAAEYFYSSTVGHAVCMTAVDSTNWIATSSTGTWAQQTP